MSISLLQVLYDQQRPLPTENEYYEKALEDIEFFAISSQIYWLLKQQDQLHQTPAFFQQRLKQQFDESLSLNVFIKMQMNQIFKAFEKICIPAIPLKGTYFAEKYYGHIGARYTSDIDLLIKPLDVAKAIACVKSLGFLMVQERIPNHFHWSFSKPLPNSPIPLTVELHWDLLKLNTSSLKMDEFWNQATPIQSYAYILELSDFHTFYMICLHGWRHNMNSLKYFIDIVQMIYTLQDKLHYADLFSEAITHKTLKRISRTLAIVYHCFPQLEKVKQLRLRKRTRLWWDYKAIRNLKYRSLNNYLNFIHYKFFDKSS